MHGVMNAHGPFAVVPHAVAIRVNVLRDISLFRPAITAQQQPNAAVAAVDERNVRPLDGLERLDRAQRIAGEMVGGAIARQHRGRG